jgi:hypothetical protein
MDRVHDRLEQRKALRRQTDTGATGIVCGSQVMLHRLPSRFIGTNEAQIAVPSPGLSSASAQAQDRRESSQRSYLARSAVGKVRTAVHGIPLLCVTQRVTVVGGGAPANDFSTSALSMAQATLNGSTGPPSGCATPQARDRVWIDPSLYAPNSTNEEAGKSAFGKPGTRASLNSWLPTSPDRLAVSWRSSRRCDAGGS